MVAMVTETWNGSRS